MVLAALLGDVGTEALSVKSRPLPSIRWITNVGAVYSVCPSGRHSAIAEACESATLAGVSVETRGTLGS
jgi:hypothetical protein